MANGNCKVCYRGNIIVIGSLSRCDYCLSDGIPRKIKKTEPVLAEQKFVPVKEKEVVEEQLQLFSDSDFDLLGRYNP